jgi:hypothetical protein
MGGRSREVLLFDQRHQRRLPRGVSGALPCCIRVLLEVLGVKHHSLSAGPDLSHGVRNVVRHVS